MHSKIQYPVSSVQCACFMDYRPAKLLLERSERQYNCGTVALSKQQYQVRNTICKGKKY
jgi:hypothetical protein